MKSNLVLLVIITSITIMMFPSEILAESSKSQNVITVIPITGTDYSIQKTVTTMIIPEDNKLPWGSVNGKALDYVERYPVIIQFFKGEDAVHFAQVDVKGDGSYEYKFRVRNVDNETGQAVNIFEGQYTIKIFKVIHNQNNVI